MVIYLLMVLYLKHLLARISSLPGVWTLVGLELVLARVGFAAPQAFVPDLLVDVVHVPLHDSLLAELHVTNGTLEVLNVAHTHTHE